MERRIFQFAMLLVLASLLTPVGPASADPFTVIRYQIFHWETDAWVEYMPAQSLPAGGDQPGTNTWKYDYIVYNWGTPQPVQQVYIFFNSDNLAMDATWTGAVPPTGWTATAVGPFEPDYNWKERFMATGSAYYIGTTDSLAGFSVEFTWTKPVLPANQIYDAVYSGGSESGLTLHKTAPIATTTTSWGEIKRLYR
jgi:hypothetical protein